MNKRAMIFNVALVFLALAVLTTVFIQLSSKQFDKEKGFDKTIGERQAKLFNIYQQAEKALFYIDQSAKLAAWQTVYDLGQRGGFSNQSACGVYYNYMLWNNKTDECYPGDIEENFIKKFNENLNDYLINYSDISLPTNNYDLELTNNLEIISKAKNPFLIGLSEEKSIVTDYNEIIEKASKKYGVPSALIKAIIKQESNFNPKAISIGCGAAGLMQLMPGTAKSLGLKTYKNANFFGCNEAYSKELAIKVKDLSIEEAAKVDERFDPEKNIMAGVKHFLSQYKKYNYDLELSTAAYNWGAGNVNRYCNLDIGFSTCTNLPDETKNYVEKVKTYYQEYSRFATYSIRPSFKTTIDYNLSVYDIIKKNVNYLKDVCSKENNLTKCLEEQIPYLNHLFQDFKTDSKTM